TDRYLCMNGSLAWASPFIWVTTIYESVFSFKCLAPISRASETSTVKPSWLSKMRPAPLPLMLEDPSVNTIHEVHGSVFPGVSSAKKYVKTWAFKAIRGSNDMSNLDSSTDHLVIRPARSGLKSTCF
ncbi:hypothetical protein A2U01_0038537, partial [Trifolium medium]|nr:hypothetical protein [Trifolium medium]